MQKHSHNKVMCYSSQQATCPGMQLQELAGTRHQPGLPDLACSLGINRLDFVPALIEVPCLKWLGLIHQSQG